MKYHRASPIAWSESGEPVFIVKFSLALHKIRWSLRGTVNSNVFDDQLLNDYWIIEQGELNSFYVPNCQVADHSRLCEATGVVLVNSKLWWNHRARGTMLFTKSKPELGGTPMTEFHPESKNSYTTISNFCFLSWICLPEPPSLQGNGKKTDNGCVSQFSEWSLETGAGNVTPGHILL